MTSLLTLEDAPIDVVSGMAFSPQHTLLVGSWDGSARVYDTRPQQLKQRGSRPVATCAANAPVTAVSWASGGQRALLGTAQGKLLEMDVENGRAVATAWVPHASGIQSICCVGDSLVASGSWDGSLHYVDHRSDAMAHQVQLPGKVFAMDATQNHLTVAMSQRLVHVYDVRNLETPLQVRESGLRHQTRAIKCMPNGKGYAQSSVEGRVAIEYFDPSPQAQAGKYAFKCHRVAAADADLVSPVNALAFHSKYNTLFTAGSDCHVCLWDHVAKKRLRQYTSLDQSVVAMDFHSTENVNMLAIATSDDSFKTLPSTDSQPQPAQSNLYIRLLGETEGLPKSMK